MPKATDRMYINYFGEFYDDALTVEAKLKDRAKTAEAASLLCAKLQEREARRNAMVQYLADKRKLSFQEMWNQLITDTYEPLTQEDFKALLAQSGETKNP